VGFALRGIEVKVCDPETGMQMSNGENGVLWVRGPNLFKGYWQMAGDALRLQYPERGRSCFFEQPVLPRRLGDGVLQRRSLEA
jgi:acyl-CoA synthetase (AMP-forming)/AMP-acid ligase II